LEAKAPLMTNANGKPITCMESATFPMMFGPVPLEKKLIIANITDDVLLGADILLGDSEGPADLLFSKKIISFRGLEIPMRKTVTPIKGFEESIWRITTQFQL
jgi:hypothetical protein